MLSRPPAVRRMFDIFAWKEMPFLLTGVDFFFLYLGSLIPAFYVQLYSGVIVPQVEIFYGFFSGSHRTHDTSPESIRCSLGHDITPNFHGKSFRGPNRRCFGEAELGVIAVIFWHSSRYCCDCLLYSEAGSV